MIPVLHVYDTLWRTASSNNGVIKDHLAQKTDISADGLTWTITLPEGVKFHDGSVLDAAAVKANIDMRQAHRTFPLKSQIAAIKETKVIDARTVQFILSRPAASLKNVMASGFYAIQSPTQMAKYPEAEYYKYASGSGPYMLDGIPNDTAIKVVRNPNYWGPKAYLDKIEFRSSTDQSAALAALEAGDVTIATLPAADFQRVTREGKVNVVPQPFLTAPIMLWFNLAKPQIADKRVRLAMVHAIDREKLLPIASGLGSIDEANAFVPPTLFGYRKYTPYPVDLAKARSLIAEAGISAGTTLNMLVQDGNPPTGDIAPVVAQAIEQLGFKVNIQLQPSVAMNAGLSAPAATSQWHIALQARTLQYADAETVYYQLFYGPNETPNGGNNSHYKNPQLDKALEAQTGILDPVARAKALGDIGQMVWDDVPHYPLIMQKRVSGTSKKLRDLDFDVAGWYWLYKAWLAE